MFYSKMRWKPFLLLVFINYVQSFHRNFDSEIQYVNKEHIHNSKLAEKSYTKPVKRAYIDDDVGEPLILTPYIEEHKIKEAKEAARVDDMYLLPGIESYSGYLTVNRKYNSNLWFWYFPVQNKPINEIPLILWLQGGPGESSLLGLFQEIGPFTAINNHTLKKNKYSWGSHYSLLFIDSPLGTGYSFSDKGGYSTNETTIGENLYTALQQFLTLFSELRTAPLYIVGQSYAAKHITSIGIQIFRHKGQDEPINLQGFAIGNGFIDPMTVLRYSYFLPEIGLIDDRTAEIMRSKEIEAANFINKDSLKAYEVFNEIVAIFKQATQLPNIYNCLADFLPSRAHEKFVQMNYMRRALHVGNTKFRNKDTAHKYLAGDYMKSVKPWLEELLDHYRIMLYSGQMDSLVPYYSIIYTYKTLNYTGAQQYKDATRKPWFHNKRLAGYYKKGGNMLEVLVRNAGHMVPHDKPVQALALILAFIENVTLEDDTGFLVN